MGRRIVRSRVRESQVRKGSRLGRMMRRMRRMEGMR
jgi:hypothetical protein